MLVLPSRCCDKTHQRIPLRRKLCFNSPSQRLQSVSVFLGHSKTEFHGKGHFVGERSHIIGIRKQKEHGRKGSEIHCNLQRHAHSNLLPLTRPKGLTWWQMPVSKYLGGRGGRSWIWGHFWLQANMKLSWAKEELKGRNRERMREIKKNRQKEKLSLILSTSRKRNEFSHDKTVKIGR